MAGNMLRGWTALKFGFAARVPAVCPALRAGTRLAAMVALVAGVSLAGGACPAAAMEADMVYTVGPVSVDATAESALAAREKALASGYAIAWDRLLDRVTFRENSAGLRDPGRVNPAMLVQGYEVLEERTSNVRYLAEISYKFNREAVRDLFLSGNIPFADIPRKPVLVIPVFRPEAGVQGGDLLWQDPNPWRDAWRRFPEPDALAPVRSPYGDLTDIRELSAAQALAGEAANIRIMATRYGAGDALVVHAALHLDAANGRRVLELSAVHHGVDGAVSVAVSPVDGALGDDPATLYDAAVQQVAAIVARNWKRTNLMRPGEESRLTVLVPIDKFGRWLSIRRKLADLQNVERMVLRRLGRTHALVDLWGPGALDQIRNALRRRELEIRPGREVDILSEPGQVIPAWMLAPSDGEGGRVPVQQRGDIPALWPLSTDRARRVV